MFAGKEILEDAVTTTPRGLWSNDPWVVENVERIYEHYVGTRRRRPFAPRHTSKVMKDPLNGVEHEISGYLHGAGLSERLRIVVKPNVFSPAVANSGKFTSWVLTRILEKDMKVLDLGSGTGVLALTAWHTLKARGTDEPVVWAVEAVPQAFANLKQNCARTGIVPHLGALAAVTERGAFLPHLMRVVCTRCWTGISML